MTAPPALMWMPQHPRLAPYAQFTLPLSGKWSKNRTHSLTKDQTGIVLRKSAREIKSAVAWSTKLAVRGMAFRQDKVWLDIMVYKLNMRSDAVNVVDIVCDGIKLGLEIDDRWYAIRQLDWEVVPANPRIVIGIGQQATSAAAASTPSADLPAR